MILKINWGDKRYKWNKYLSMVQDDIDKPRLLYTLVYDF